MQTQKKVKDLGKVIEDELINLKSLDRLAWFQIGDYMVQLRKKINGHMRMSKSKRSKLDPLCAQLKELDEQFADSMEPRVLRFLLGMRIEIARQILKGQVRLGPINKVSDFWPKINEKEADAAEESEGNVMPRWMKEGFPID